jgi:hypothetical protein
MCSPAVIHSLEGRREQLLAQLAAIGNLRPGSLTERYRKCGKPNCHCATEPNGGHGPSFSLSRQVKGKTIIRIIPREAVAETRAQLAECQRFRSLSAELIEVSERLCDARLKHHKQVSSETAQAEKGGSRARSQRKSRRRSGP